MDYDLTVADAQKIIDEALAFLDMERTGLLEIMDNIREQGGDCGQILAPYVAPYVSKATLVPMLQVRELTLF